MKARGLSEAAIGAFKRNFDQLVAGVTGMVRVWPAEGARALAAAASACAPRHDAPRARIAAAQWSDPPIEHCPCARLCMARRAHVISLASARADAQVPEAEIEPVTQLPHLRSLPNTNGNVQVIGRALQTRGRPIAEG